MSAKCGFPVPAGLRSGLIGVTLLLGGCAGIEPPTAVTGASARPADSVLYVEYEEVREVMAPLIQRVRKKYDIAGLSVALVDHGQIVWAEGFGFADREAAIEATPSTVYRVGSVAKPFTATAVMQLEEQGVVDIDQPLFFALPGFSVRSRFNTTAQPITVRSVLTHHSGLPTDLGKGMWSDQAFTEVLDRLPEEYTAFPPDLVFSYSNVGYTLLGHLVEQNGGRPFEDYMREAVFDPVGMPHTAYRVTDAIRPLLSKGYRNGKSAELLPIRDLPAFGLYTSAEDLARFMSTLMAHPTHSGHGGRPILGHETVVEMFDVQNADVELDLQIRNGIGWFLEYDSIPGAGYVARHGGTTLLFASEMVLLPEHRLGVAVLSNTRGTRKVVSHLAEDILTEALKSRGDIEPGNPGLQIARWEEQQREERVMPMIGSYATGLGMVAIRPKSDKLCACVADATIDLIPMPNGWYGVSPDSVDSLPKRHRNLAKLRFATREIGGRQVILAERGGKQVVLGEKVQPTPVPEAWRKRVGTYELLNADARFPLENPTVWYRDGMLGMSYRVPILAKETISVPLRPISDTEAVILGLGRTRGETLRAVEQGGREVLRYSGYVGRRK